MRPSRGYRRSARRPCSCPVPPIAAFGAVLFLGELLTPRLATASAAILGGIALVLASRTQRRRAAAPLDPGQTTKP